QVHHGLIPAMVTKLEFISLAAQGEAHDLVTEAYTENRFLADQLLHVLLGIGNRIGIARAVGKKNAVGIQSQYLFGRARRRPHFDATPRLSQVAQNVELDPVIVGHNQKNGSAKRTGFFSPAFFWTCSYLASFVTSSEIPHPLVPIVGFRAGHIANEIAS